MAASRNAASQIIAGESTIKEKKKTKKLIETKTEKVANNIPIDYIIRNEISITFPK